MKISKKKKKKAIPKKIRIVFLFQRREIKENQEKMERKSNSIVNLLKK